LLTHLVFATQHVGYKTQKGLKAYSSRYVKVTDQPYEQNFSSRELFWTGHFWT